MNRLRVYRWIGLILSVGLFALNPRLWFPLHIEGGGSRQAVGYVHLVIILITVTQWAVTTHGRLHRFLRKTAIPFSVAVAGLMVLSLFGPFALKGTNLVWGLDYGRVCVWRLTGDSARVVDEVARLDGAARDLTKLFQLPKLSQTFLLYSLVYMTFAPEDTAMLLGQWDAKLGAWNSIVEARAVDAPLTWLALLLLVPRLAIAIQDRRKIPPGHCQVCRYDLTGNVSGVCPECGAAAVASESASNEHALAGPRLG